LTSLALLLVALSYVKVVVNGRVWWQKYARPWMLHSAGQLHWRIAALQYKHAGAVDKDEIYPYLPRGLEGLDLFQSFPTQLASGGCATCFLGGSDLIVIVDDVVSDESHGNNSPQSDVAP
jgi:hypothetical protein